MQGLVTVFGGSGFLGQQIVRVLAKQGRRVRVAVRNPGRAYRLPMLGDVGQIEIVQANLRNADSVARALDGAEGAVNAVGGLYEAGRQRFDLHDAGAQMIARAAAAEGVARLVHISAIGAQADSPAKYARSKAAGEAQTREAVPGSVVLRPSVVFGAADQFFNRFAAMALVSPLLPLIGGGETLFQPVFVGDVAAAVGAALTDPAAAGRTYELGGPSVDSFKALMGVMLKAIERNRVLAPIPFPIAGLLGSLGDAMALTGLFAPPITSDQVAMLRTHNVVAEGAFGLADLGVRPTALEPIIPTYLYRFRPGGQYAEQTRAAQAAAG